jgi:hypothetical protein
MIDFLKNFFAGDKPAEPRKRDVLLLDAYAMGEDEEEQQGGGCGTSSNSGCGGCGCG